MSEVRLDYREDSFAILVVKLFFEQDCKMDDVMLQDQYPSFKDIIC